MPGSRMRWAKFLLIPHKNGHWEEIKNGAGGHFKTMTNIAHLGKKIPDAGIKDMRG